MRNIIILKQISGDGFSNGYTRQMSENVTFKVFDNATGLHCFIRGIGQGDDKDKIIEIPFDFIKKEREVYFHFIDFERENLVQSGLTQGEIRHILKDFEYVFMGREAYKIISESAEFPLIKGTKRYSQSRLVKETLYEVSWDESDVENASEVAKKYAEDSIIRMNRLIAIGDMGE